jgi:hypothetical protein
LQRAIIRAIKELDVFAGVVAARDGVLYDDVQLIRYDLVLLRVLEAGEEGRDVDGRERDGERRDSLSMISISTESWRAALTVEGICSHC